MSEIERLLTLREAAAAIGVSPKILRAELTAGNLRYVAIGKRRKFTSHDLAEMVEKRRTSWESQKGRIRPSGGMTSRSRVIGLEEARKLRPAATRKK